MEIKYLKVNEIVNSISETHSFVQDELYAVNTSDVENGRFLTPPLIKCEDLKGQFKKTIKKNDILFSEIRPINAHFALVDLENTDDYVASTKLMVLRKYNDDVDLLYFYYWLTNKKMLSILQSRAENRICSFPQITFELLSEYKVPVPSINIQRKIASILKSIDDKIENNNAINTELEAMAKTLYDYWFLQYEYPNNEGKPYKSSGGSMVWNNDLNREIPEGWENGTLNDYVGRITNGLNPRKNFKLGSGNNFYITIKSLLGTEIDWENCDKCDDEALKKINARSQIQVGDIIFSAIGTIGRTYYIQEQPLNWNISETSFTLRARKEIPSAFLYSLLRSDGIQLIADKRAMGSTLRCLVMKELLDIPTAKIPVDIIKKFSHQVVPMYKKIYENNKESRELASLRDFLLPMLMNGQVGFKDLAKN